MNNDPELQRVMSNPDHVIVSDSLIDILEDHEKMGDEGKIEISVIWDSGFISGQLISLKKKSSFLKVAIKARSFGSLIVLQDIDGKDVAVEFNDGMYDHIISGTAKEITLNREKLNGESIEVGFLVLTK